MPKRAVTPQDLVALVLLVGCGVAGCDRDKPGSNAPHTGIVKVTSSYKAGETPGELSVEILEWGNDTRKVSDGKLPGKAAGGNPFLHAQDLKVGDYVVYNVTEKCDVFAAASRQATWKSTLTVSHVDKKAASFEADGDSLTADLTKPFDMCTAVATIRTPGYGFYGLARNKDQMPFGFQKTGEGKEMIKIGNKTYECTWIEGKVDTKVRTEAGDTYQFTAAMKIWIANDMRAQP